MPITPKFFVRGFDPPPIDFSEIVHRQPKAGDCFLSEWPGDWQIAEQDLIGEGMFFVALPIKPNGAL